MMAKRGEPAPNDPNKQNAESYGAIIENEFRSPQVEPRSAFSSEVNTTSDANYDRVIERVSGVFGSDPKAAARSSWSWFARRIRMSGTNTRE